MCDEALVQVPVTYPNPDVTRAQRADGGTYAQSVADPFGAAVSHPFLAGTRDTQPRRTGEAGESIVPDFLRARG